MTTSLLQFVLVACSLMLLASARKMDTDREALIDAAIQEVKMEVSHVQTTKLSKAQQMLKAFKMASPKSKAQGMAAYRFERMVNLAERKILKSRRQATAQSSSMAEALAMELLHRPGSILTGKEIARMYQESECAEVIEFGRYQNCDSPAVQKHRTANGTCNNLENPTYGAAGTRMGRLLPARYDDGFSVPRAFMQSQDLPFTNGVFNPPNPSPRIASLAVVEDREINDSVHTHILMQWGQFMDHDLDAMPEFEVCPDGCELSPEEAGMCYPFRVTEDDDNVLVTRTDPDSVGCHGFRRSLPACPEEEPSEEDEHGLDVREQINAITHFIDGSNVYHHDPDVQDNFIRDPDSDSGLLRVGDRDPGDSTRFLLPDTTAEERIAICPPDSPNTCFLAGDFRVNEQSALSVMHTLWVREHNRIAPIILDGNPGYDSNKVFLTTREIVSAIIAKITYKDYLPRILGSRIDELIPPFGSVVNGKRIKYDPTVDPRVPNAFAAAAYRFGHSQIQPFFEMLDTNYQSIAAGPLSLNDAFFNTTAVRTDGIGPILRGLVGKNARKVDEFINSVLTNNLFAPNEDSPGLDLASLNIQRGRDHGLPPYIIWKQWAKTVCDLESDFRNELTEIHFLQVYGSLDTVDLFVGGLAEEPLEGGIVGAVFACIFAKTFEALRDGDRFYYENTDGGAFTSAQIAEIEKASLSRVICDNTDTTQIQPNAFLVEDDGANSRVDCNSLPSVALSAWTQSTGKCYARITTNRLINVIGISLNSRGVHFHSGPYSGAGCVPINCPDGARDNTRLAIFTLSRRCTHESNVNLPPSESFFPRAYRVQQLAPQFIVPSNGFYPTEMECENANIDAVSFSCSTFTSAKSQQTGTVDVDTDLDGVSDLTDDEAANEFVNGGKAASASKQDRLVSLMEEVLQTLKQTSNVEETKEVAKEENEEDAELVSELEKLLQKA